MIDVAELKDELPVTEVLEHYGWVDDTTGRGWNDYQRTLCPFHDDHEPSATVNVSTNRFHCFTCGTSGDVIDIVMIEENMDFKEAVNWLLETFQVTLSDG